MSLTISAMARESYTTACQKGFHDEPREFGTAIALIHSEVSEALEVHRSLKPYHQQAQELYFINDVATHPVNETKYIDGHGVAYTETQIVTLAKELQKDHLAEELADILIRVGDTAIENGLDLEPAVLKKMAKNAGRPHMHGGKAY